MIKIDIIELEKNAAIYINGDIIEGLPFDEKTPGYWCDCSSSDIVNITNDMVAYASRTKLNEDDHFYELPLIFSGKKLNRNA
jgi:hypothetical protein